MNDMYIEISQDMLRAGLAALGTGSAFEDALRSALDAATSNEIQFRAIPSGTYGASAPEQPETGER